ncbi:ATP-binding protein [Halothermothrix orenii]|uniref:Cobyrinic acid ac-diamide synthase n=1 Tax=Halothermothrix orenii (strain H 168 / OCM 544 / DSM 9562) TaxID=373903 RepID=B8CZ68_HALOH|nr:ATP-binding protein [Halothermothrix orenii]ACL70587.1 Cobyrinic acid ac-diamide synthase [Halothermothrix orenii H 168]
MKISILSGKGGTGKTTVAVNMALALTNVQLIDADVEEPNDHLFLDITDDGPYESVTRDIPVVDNEKCTGCRKCVDFCQYNALALMADTLLVFPEICHSCGGCKLICPAGAIKEEKREVGKLREFKINDNLYFFQGELNTGEEQAVPVIEKLKSKINNKKTVIIDAPPGSSCPAVEAIEGTDFCLLVTEPTPFGLHDLKMVVDLVKKLGIPSGVIINRAEEDSNHIITSYCREEGIPVLMKIPFSKKIAKWYSNGIPFIMEEPQWSKKFQKLYREIEGVIQNEKSYSY